MTVNFFVCNYMEVHHGITLWQVEHRVFQVLKCELNNCENCS